MTIPKGSRSIRGSRTAPPDFDDLSGNCYRVDPDGFGLGSRQRILRPAGTCDHRWITGVGGFDGIYRSLGRAAGLPESQRFGRITGPSARTDTNALASKADLTVGTLRQASRLGTPACLLSMGRHFIRNL